MATTEPEIPRPHSAIAKYVAECADQVTVALDALIPAADGPEARLMRAMRHAALAPGWRYKPFLVIESGRIFGTDERSLLRAATAVECITAFAQAHEDLPSLGGGPRRNQMRLHEAFDEATAILAGDALFALAFEILADRDTAPDAILRVKLIQRLAHAIGARGRMAGRMLQCLSGEFSGDMNFAARQHRLTATPLTIFAVEVGALMGGASDEHRHALTGFAQDLALAREIHADLVQDEGAEAERQRSGTPPDGGGYVGLFGREAAARRIDILAQQARAHLLPLGTRAGALGDSIDLVLARTRPGQPA